MKIRELDLINFGKFNKKQIAFKQGINLVYGKNESGKTTIHTFIKSMLFGMERGRGRAAANDTFSKYEPWDEPNYYAGVLRFVCGGRSFRLERSFSKYGKKASLFCEDDGEELSVADGDLEMILSGLTKANYEDTLYVGQLHAKTSQALSVELKNYATNYYVSGDSDIDLAAALNLLRDKQKEADKEMRFSLQKKQRERERIEQEASFVWREIHVLETEMEDVEQALESRKEEAPIEKKRVVDELRPSKWRVHPVEIITMIAVCVLAFVILARPWNYLVTIVVALLGGIFVWNRLKEGKKKQKTTSEIMLEETATEEELYSNEKLLWEQEHLQGELKEKRIQYENLQEQLAELDELGGEVETLDRKKAALALAGERLEELSRAMRSQMGMELNRLASEIIDQMTCGKYTRLFVDENLQMSVMENGRKVALEQVSQGTVEQMYFAFRMAAAKILHEEEYPVILDDTLVFYDEERLEQTLNWLADNKKQVILFTCQNREEKILQKTGILYNKIVL